MNRSGWLFFLLFLLLFFLLPGAGAQAAIDVYEFGKPVQERRFRHLTEELRCPKCQNQNIADSNAPLAADLRQKVADMINAGRSDNEIVAYMVERYGDFVTYRPPFKPITLLLWLGPAVVIVGIGLGLLVWVRRRGREQTPAELSAAERARLDALLAEQTEKPR